MYDEQTFRRFEPFAAHDYQCRQGHIHDVAECELIETERLNHLRYFESMDQVNRAMQGTHDLETMMRDVLDTVLSIFDCDRAFLMYPCDPEADSWRVPMESNRPEYPGLFALGVPMSMDEEVAAVLRIVLASDGSVTYGPTNEHPLPGYVSEEFGYKSLMAMAIRPKGDQPWLFGIHQCSRARGWTPDEKKLLREIGRRLTDGLTSLLAYRDLKASERKFRSLTENSPDFIARYDRDCRRIYVNPAMRHNLDWSVACVLGKTPMDGSGLAAPDIYQAKLRAVLTSGQPDSVEAACRRSDGSQGWGDIRFEPEFDCDGHVVGVLAVGRDITELVNSRRELAESRELLRRLETRNEAAREEERKRISRELHDELGQLLTSLRLNLSLMQMQLGEDQAYLQGIVAECADMAEATIKSARDIASALRPLALDMGLVPAIQWQLEQFIEHAGIVGQLVLDDETIAPPESESLSIFRILQESLTNVARHAQARWVHVSLGVQDRAYVLKVRDDGLGFDHAAPLRSGALGLLGMRERALALGGELNIVSAPGAGTELMLAIPVRAHNEGEKT